MASFPMAIRAQLPRSIFTRFFPSTSNSRPLFSAVSHCHRHGQHHYRHLNSTSISSSSVARPKIAWLDLRGTGLSALERLAIEELLLRHDPLKRCWAIVGSHEPTEARLLNNVSLPHNDHDNDDWNAQRKRNANDNDNDRLEEEDVYGHTGNHGVNKSCAIIMGIGGKPERLININSAKNDGVLVLKRFSGGGTVVIDPSSLWTTFIMRNDALPEVKPYPREIMEWSANAIFGPAFDSWNREIMSGLDDGGSLLQTGANNGNGMVADNNVRKRRRGKQTLVFQGKSCGFSGGVGESLILPPKEEENIQQQHRSASSLSLPKFRLEENDYVLGERKIGGNAQSIVSGGFLHHTSFLWDYDRSNMEYLSLPEKRPEYRGERSHDDFLVRLKDHYGEYSGKNSLFGHVKDATSQSFELEQETNLRDVLEIANEKFGGLQGWFDGKCRTKVVKL